MDTMVQYLVCAIVIPALNFMLQGILILGSQPSLLAALIGTVMRHVTGKLCDFPEAFFHHWKGAHIPLLQTRVFGESNTTTAAARSCGTTWEAMGDKPTAPTRRLFQENLRE
ncbi:hypothetical protein GGF37_004368 [Kickxella alabastrina]|nr:hypothetical protein GGF37_004368 [Kickxella alabastrina]